MNTNKILAEAIAKDYLPKNDSKIIALKKLDRRAKLPATVVSYPVGILSSLIAGLGMSLAMGVIGGGMALMTLGIILGLVGFAGCGISYPLYKHLLENGIKEYAAEIVELAKEISQE